MQLTHVEHRALAQTVVVLLWVVLLGSVQACKKEVDPDPGFGPEGQPRVLAVRIPDIPDQNIRIDQDAKQITVTIPTSFSANVIKPTLTLTPNTNTVTSNGYTIDVYTDVSSQPLGLTTSNNKTNTYAIVLKPAGDLTFGAFSGPQSYSLSDKNTYVCLPVYNYVDGSGYQTNSVMLVNKATGERFKPEAVVYGRESLCDKTPRQDGAVMATIYLNSFYMYYQPGEYSIEFSKANGRKATLAQSIQLVKGATSAKFDAAYPLKLNSGDYFLFGSNIYKGDKLSVRIQGRNQPTLTVDALGFIDNQPGIRLPTAINLKPGYYYAQLLVNGVPAPSTDRITIIDQAKSIIVGSLSLPGQTPYTNLLGGTYGFDTPIALTKGVTYTISTNAYVFTQQDSKASKRIRLTLLTDRTTVYYAPIVLDNGSERISVPGTVPSGSYELTVQVVSGDGTIIDGIPLERDVVIQ